jgi:hypothetical protein
VSVCALVDPILHNESVNSTIKQALKEIIFHPLTLKLFSKAELFPLNFAVRLCYDLQLQGEKKSLDPIILTLYWFYRRLPKECLLYDNRHLFLTLLSTTVLSPDDQVLKKLSEESEPVLALLQEGDHYASLCSFVVNCMEQNIPLDKSGQFYEKVVWGLQKALDNGERSMVLKAQTILRTLPFDYTRLNAPVAALKRKMMDALLKHQLFSEASEWMDFLGKETLLPVLTPETLMEWIPALIAGKQFNASAGLMSIIAKASNEVRDAGARLWLSFPEEMYSCYPQLGSKCVLRASRELTEELKPVVQKILEQFLEPNAPPIPLENVLPLLERYVVPHPAIWRIIFAKAEAQPGKEHKAKQKLLSLLTTVAEPAGFMLTDPESRRACWLSALRSFSSSSSDRLGNVWREVLENEHVFFQIFPASDQEVAGEAFLRLLDVWFSSMEKPNENPDLFKGLTPLLEKMLYNILRDPGTEMCKQKILLQLIHDGCHTNHYQVFLNTCGLFLSLLKEMRRVRSTINSNILEIEAAKALKKLLSIAQTIIKKNPVEQPFLEGVILTKMLTDTGNVLDGEIYLGILEHLLTFDLFITDKQQPFFTIILDVLLQKFDKSKETRLFSELPHRDKIIHIITELLKKIEMSQGCHPDFLLRYAHVCMHPMFPFFTRPEEQRIALNAILQMITSLKNGLSKETQKVLTNYMISGFPVRANDEYKMKFFSFGLKLNMQMLVLTENEEKFYEGFEKFIELYGIHLSPVKVPINAIKQKNGMHYFVVEEILDACTIIQETVDAHPDKPFKPNHWTKIVVDYFCVKIIEILELIPTSQLDRKLTVYLIDSILKHPSFLREGYMISYFKGLKRIFDRFRVIGLYNDHLNERLFHALLLHRDGEDLPISSRRAILEAMMKVQNWTIASKESFCVYVMLDILELNQEVIYIENPLELRMAYEIVIKLVMKNPFYMILLPGRKDPKHTVGLCDDIEQGIDNTASSKQKYNDPQNSESEYFPPTCNKELSLIEILLFTFLKLDTQLLCSRNEIWQNSYREIWRQLFVMLMEMINLVNDHKVRYPQILLLLIFLLGRAQYETDQTELQLSANASIFIQQFFPQFNEKSTQVEFREFTAQLASIVEILNHTDDILDKDSRQIDVKNVKMDKSLCMINRVTLFLSLNSVPSDLVLAFISKVFIPASLATLLNRLSKNEQCTVEEKLEIYLQVYKKIMENMLQNINRWSFFFKTIFTTYFEEVSSFRQALREIHKGDSLERAEIFKEIDDFLHEYKVMNAEYI